MCMCVLIITNTRNAHTNEMNGATATQATTTTVSNISDQANKFALCTVCMLLCLAKEKEGEREGKNWTVKRNSVRKTKTPLAKWTERHDSVYSNCWQYAHTLARWHTHTHTQRQYLARAYISSGAQCMCNCVWSRYSLNAIWDFCCCCFALLLETQFDEFVRIPTNFNRIPIEHMI